MCSNHSLVLFATVLVACTLVQAAPRDNTKDDIRDSRTFLHHALGNWPYGGAGGATGGGGGGGGFLSSLPWPFGAGGLLSALSSLGDIELPNGTPLGLFAPAPLPPLIGGQAVQALQPLRYGKPGVCPYVNRLVPTGSDLNLNLPASVCGNLCHDDSSCPLAQKCCPHECGYSCFNPVRITH